MEDFLAAVRRTEALAARLGLKFSDLMAAAMNYTATSRKSPFRGDDYENAVCDAEWDQFWCDYEVIVSEAPPNTLGPQPDRTAPFRCAC